MAEFKIQLHERAKNVEQIEDYWFRRLRALEAHSGTALARADLQYLVETGRADESVFDILQDKPNYWSSWLAKARDARKEDGDLTIWSTLYPLEEET